MAGKEEEEEEYMKTKMRIFKVYYFASGTYSLAFKVYLEYVYCIFSYT